MRGSGDKRATLRGFGAGRVSWIEQLSSANNPVSHAPSMRGLAVASATRALIDSQEFAVSTHLTQPRTVSAAQNQMYSS